MKVRTVIGLATIGGLLMYLYKKRGGEFTRASFKRTMRELFRRARSEARDLKERAERLKERAERQITHEGPGSDPRRFGQQY